MKKCKFKVNGKCEGKERCVNCIDVTGLDEVFSEIQERLKKNNLQDECIYKSDDLINIIEARGEVNPEKTFESCRTGKLVEDIKHDQCLSSSEMFAALDEGLLVTNESIKKSGKKYIYQDDEGRFRDDKDYYIRLEFISNNEKWELYEDNKNCLNCGYMHQLNNGELMCCKDACDTEEYAYCDDFVEKGISIDYQKAMRELAEKVKNDKELW